MREIDVRRGTVNGAAKFAAVFRLSMKNPRGGPLGPPIGTRVKIPNLAEPGSDVDTAHAVRRGSQSLRSNPLSSIPPCRGAPIIYFSD